MQRRRAQQCSSAAAQAAHRGAGRDRGVRDGGGRVSSQGSVTGRLNASAGRQTEAPQESAAQQVAGRMMSNKDCQILSHSHCCCLPENSGPALTQSLTHSLPRYLSNSLTRSLTLTNCLTQSPILPLAQSTTRSFFTQSLSDSLPYPAIFRHFECALTASASFTSSTTSRHFECALKVSDSHLPPPPGSAAC